MIDKHELRRFPPPQSVEETDACFIVRDANGQALVHVYFEDEPGRRSANNIFLIRRHVVIQRGHFSMLLGQHNSDDALGNRRIGRSW